MSMWMSLSSIVTCPIELTVCMLLCCMYCRFTLTVVFVLVLLCLVCVICIVICPCKQGRVALADCPEVKCMNQISEWVWASASEWVSEWASGRVVSEWVNEFSHGYPFPFYNKCTCILCINRDCTYIYIRTVYISSNLCVTFNSLHNAVYLIMMKKCLSQQYIPVHLYLTILRFIITKQGPSPSFPGLPELLAIITKASNTLNW